MGKKFTIGFEATGLLGRKPTGIAVYTSNLIHALEGSRDFSSYFNINLLIKISRVLKASNRNCLANHNYQFHYNNTIFGHKRNDIIHSPDSIFVNNNKALKIATIHDLAIFKEQNQMYLYTTPAFRTKMFDILKRITSSADYIVAVSENTKQDLLEMFPFPEDKIRVVYPGIRKKLQILPDVEIVKKKYQIFNPYILFVGLITARKNLLNIIKAYELVNNFEIDLVLVGNFSLGHEDIIDYIESSPKKQKIHMLNYVSDSDLHALYSFTEAVVFPTYYEGFGMPILEAMLYEKPVIIGKYGAAPEVASGYGLITDPFDLESIALGIKTAIENSDVDYKAAREHAESFTWEASANKMILLYKEAILS